MRIAIDSVDVSLSLFPSNTLFSKSGKGQFFYKNNFRYNRFNRKKLKNVKIDKTACVETNERRLKTKEGSSRVWRGALTPKG